MNFIRDDILGELHKYQIYNRVTFFYTQNLYEMTSLIYPFTFPVNVNIFLYLVPSRILYL